MPSPYSISAVRLILPRLTITITPYQAAFSSNLKEQKMPIYDSVEDLCPLLDDLDLELEARDWTEEPEHPVEVPPPHPESSKIFLARLPHQMPGATEQHYEVGPERMPRLMIDREPRQPLIRVAEVKRQTSSQVPRPRPTTGGLRLASTVQTPSHVPRPRPTTGGLRLASAVAWPSDPERSEEESEGEQREAGRSRQRQRRRPTTGGLRLASTVAQPSSPERSEEESEGEQPEAGGRRQAQRRVPRPRPTTGGLRLASTVTR